eukprot:CAMPEP_0195508098 /NCGR_PEP_ID=MMETSP0794_2-20130614/1404_1 /TAXON_ID=515487 /ORGANISM="Stephanopyxis turris, Strain CCMP 815" /LENGTH=213 /DNA_ID=CAMNT_0040634973 /DNA_START=108 /DNA_END=749 /DNA_ORIENTATION=+
MGFKCCDRPQGNHVFLPMLLTLVALALSNRADRWCDYFYRPDSINTYYPYIGGDQVGPWTYRAKNGNCYFYPDNVHLDTKFNAARVFSMWTTLMGVVLLIYLSFSTCCGMTRGCWAFVGFFLLVNCLFEGLVFLMMSATICDPSLGTPCFLDTGASFGISAIVFWFLAGISVASVPAPVGPEPVVVEQTITTTETIAPDGTKTTTIETTQHVV